MFDENFKDTDFTEFDGRTTRQTENCYKCNTILELAADYDSDVTCPSCGVSYACINGSLYPLDDHG